MDLPKLGTPLTKEQITFLETFTKSCRKSILEMVVNSQSGHPGGSLSEIDYLATLYAFIIGQTGEKVVVSNGHTSPAVYSVLAEMGYVDKNDAVANFRKDGSKFEGHITRHVDGVEFGTGPLGVGVTVGEAFALADPEKKSYGLMGDGEMQEGQVYEMMNFASHYNLNNYILFVDYNKVQLTASLKDVQELDIPALFEAAGWEVIEFNGHDFYEIWNALSKAQDSKKPVAMIGSTVMGKGVKFMEEEGLADRPTWHGKAPKAEEVADDLKELTPTEDEEKLLEEFRSQVSWKPTPAKFPKKLSSTGIDEGERNIYTTEELTDCRSAYGKALLDLAKRNKKIVAFTADLKGSVMTKFVSAELPDQYYECGIAEQNMVSLAGGFSLTDHVPFASTFGAFLTSRPKDQARVNDINYTNVKMVATHCGLSVGEDGPTHQAIDDMGTMLGHFNTMVVEPADPNQCDIMTRYIASHYGNFYMRMGRHKFPVITKEDGTPFYDESYEYEYGRTDVLREGSAVTIAATGATITEALAAREQFDDPSKVEVVAISSIKKFDDTIATSVRKTGKLITVEDHNTRSGLGSQLAKHLLKHGIATKITTLGVKEYQLSGKPAELYARAGIDAAGIKKAAEEML